MWRRICFILGVVAISVGFFATTDAKIWRVPEEVYYIQGGIDSCSTAPGVRDTVSVLQGTPGSPTIYYENIDFKGKSLLLSSRPIEGPDPSATVIDGQQQGSVVTFENGEDETAEIRGFTITNGAGKYMESLKDNQLIIVIEDSSVSLGKHLGGGILCDGSSPVITNNIISGNSSCPGSGGGIACVSHSSPKISENQIVDNVGFCGGGIICALRSSPTIRGNLIKDNIADCGGTAGVGGGVLCDDSCRISIVSCVIDSNHAKWTGAGICVGDTTFVAIDSCDIRYNSCAPSYFDGGGIAAYGAEYGDSITLSNSVVTGNTAHIVIPVPNAGGIFLNNWAYANLGDVEIEIPGNNLICDNKDYDLVYLNSTVTKAEGNNWGSVDTDTIQSSIYGSIEFDPIAYSGHIAYNSTCSTGVLITGDVWVDEDVTLNLKGGDITVPSGITLTIQQGAQARFSAGADNQCSGVDTTLSELIVEGDLNAQGTASEPVTFTSTSSNKGDWYGIRVMDGGSADIQHANINYGYCGVYLGSGCNASVKYSHISHNEVYGVRCQTSDADIRFNTLEYNERYGVYASNCLPIINYNRISNHPSSAPSYGIYCNLVTQTSAQIKGNHIGGSDKEIGIYLYHSRPTVTQDTVVSDSVGIVCFDSEAPINNNWEIRNNKVGLECHDHAAPVLRDNDIYNNTLYGVYVATSSNPDLGWADSTDRGGNNIYGNSVYNLYNNTYKDPPYYAVCVKAEGNWWGQSPPDTTKLYGCVDYDPWAVRKCPRQIFPKTAGITDQLPKEFSLSQNYPNPFNPVTKIEYALPEGCHVSLKVYNILGRLVATLVDEKKLAGYYSAIWNGKGASGKQVASGVYIYQIRAGNYTSTKKLVVLR